MLTIMSSRKNHFSSRSHRFLPVASGIDDSVSLTMDSESAFEFDESEIYNSAQANSFEFQRFFHGRGSNNSSAKKKPSSSSSGAPASVPVNIPDWSKILGDEYRRRNSFDDNDNDNNEGYDDERSGRVPPHEFLARNRVASFSVHEGVGRTLKGRDLSTLRNAIWAKTGFQD